MSSQLPDREKVQGIGRSIIVILGLSLFLTWVFFVFAMDVPTLLRSPLSTPLRALTLCVPSTLLMLWFVFRPNALNMYRLYDWITWPLLAALGTALLAITPPAFSSESGSAIVGNVLIGCGYGCLSALWLHALSTLCDHYHAYIGVGLALVGPIILLVAKLPSEVMPFVLVCMPLASIVGLVLIRAGTASTVTNVSRTLVLKIGLIALQTGAILLGLAALLAMQGVVLKSSLVKIPPAYLICSVAFGALFALAVKSLNRAVPLHARYRIPLLAIIGGYMGISFLSRPGLYHGALVPSLAWTNLLLGTGLVFSLLIASARELPVPATSVFAAGRAISLMTSMAAQFLLGGLQSPPSLLMLVVAFLLMIAITLAPDVITILQPSGESEYAPSADRTDPANYTAASCARIASQYGLTAREEEILCLLAEGRSRPRISQELVISEGTTKTHVDHIYGKLGVHTRQELLDLTGARRAALRERKRD